MLLRKPVHAGSSPTPSSTRLFSEIDGSLSSFTASSISPPPVPTGPQSKTHAFFSSPFSTAPPSPLLSPPKPIISSDGSSPIAREKPTPPPPRSLTADFFSSSSSFTPPRPQSQSARRNILGLELKGEVNRLDPFTLAGAFASTPTPTEIRDEFIQDDPSSKPKPSYSESPNQPTPKPPAVVFNQNRLSGIEMRSSAPSITDLGTEPDAEVLSSSPSFSHLSTFGLNVAQGLSTYPSRPTSSHSFYSGIQSQEMSAGMTHLPSEPDALYPAGDEEELASGMIIRSFLPSSRRSTSSYPPISVSSATPPSSTSSTPAASVPVTLRLSRALGQGTFSSVWLAEDLSPTSLILRSRKSLKDLKRKSTLDKGLDKASEHEPSERKNGKLKSSLSTTSSLMRRLRGGVSGTRPGGASASSSKGHSSDKPYASVAMGRHGTLMPSPSLPINGLAPGIPPSLIPGHPSSSASSTVSSRTLGLGLPVNNVPSDQQRIYSGRSVYLEFNDDTSGSLSPPMSPNLYSDRLSISGLDGHNSSASGSISRASSISWKSSASSDESHEAEGAASASRSSSTKSSTRKSNRSRLVAVKLTSRGVIEERDRVPGQVLSRRDKLEEEERARERDRTRVSFVREVEVLKHISHPNITPLLSHLTTRTHHVLVLPYLPGGDLLGLVNDDVAWNNLGENTLRRIFSELCKAVSWMHGVGLVHRDIKLENILLTVSLSSGLLDGPNSATTVTGVGLTESTTSSPTSYTFSDSKSAPSSPTSYSHDSSMPPPPTNPSTFPTLSQPLIKLTDFGLSRFIDSANPLLTTRCGSEAYAAPELVVSGGRAGVASSRKSPWFAEDQAAGYASEAASEREGGGGYDARETDAWACGIVLYALVARQLPFGEGPGEALGSGPGKISGEGGSIKGFSPMERRQWLMNIARSEWRWPESEEEAFDEGSELRGPGLVHCSGARRAVKNLLVRDPSRRARVKDLWNDDWVTGSGFGGRATPNSYESRGDNAGPLPDLYPSYTPRTPAEHLVLVSSRVPSGLPTPPSLLFPSNSLTIPDVITSHEDVGEEFDNDRREKGDAEMGESEPEEDELDEEEYGDGWLVDKEGINSIARSEVPR